MKLPLATLFILSGMIGVPAADLVADSASLARAQAGRNEPRPANSARAGEGGRRAEAASGSETTTDSAKEASGEGVQVTAWRFISTKELTRVMLDLSREAKFDVHRLKEDPAQRLPARIYIDIIGARLALASKEPLAVDDEALRQVRIGQHGGDSVRVVLDMNEPRAHNVFLTADPTRLVIDIAGRGGSGKLPAKEVSAKTGSAAPRPTAQARKAEAPAPASGLRKIVLDPGHGGKDPGAIGVGGAAEKDVVLGVAKKLARKLHAELGVKVVLTRNDDRYVPLEDRTALANSEDADLFISLHMNASPNAEARGIETYYLDNTTDEAAIRLAARENRTSRRNISDLQFILSDMMQNVKLEDSITLAHRLQGALVGGMSRMMADVKDLGVKKALFHVLVGARMPSVLVEMFFITHRVEGAAMGQERYQDAMVDALYEGIERYGQTNIVAKTL
jgi:N-acetylmuramoyl-L-alanine amidase